MNAAPVIPAPDALPLPGPIWLFESLLILTFVLHIVAMNLLFGGSILAVASHMRGRRDARHAQLARRLARAMPVVVAFTITLGVAPLLFVQVLYGQFVYTSSILMANAWFAVIPLLIIGYYTAYLLRFKWESLGGLRTAAAWLIAIIVVTIGFIYTHNFTLMLRPETWSAHYAASPASGHLNLSDTTLYPRYLHTLIGAVAVAGLWIVILGRRVRSSDPEWADWAATYGAKIFMHATLLNVIIGLWFLIVLPRRAQRIFMGGDSTATIALVAAVVCTVVAWWMLYRAAKSPRVRGPAIFGAALLFGVLVLMAITRQHVRVAYLAPYFRLETLEVAPQWDLFALFAAILALGLVGVAWLVRVALRAQPADA